jgi:hypothetical protein
MADPLAPAQAAQGTPGVVDRYQFDQNGRPTGLAWTHDLRGALNYRSRPKRRPHVVTE